jgi:hypothetical protein
MMVQLLLMAAAGCCQACHRVVVDTSAITSMRIGLLGYHRRLGAT